MLYDNYHTMNLPSLLEPTSSPLFSLIFDHALQNRRSAKVSGDFSLSEDERHVYFEADAPGMKLEDIEVTFENGVLWIKAERRKGGSSKDTTHHFTRASSFSYQVPISSVDEECTEPKASYKDGVIRIVFDKKLRESPKKILVKEE